MKKAIPILCAFTIVLASALVLLQEVVKYDDERERFIGYGETVYYLFDGSSPIDEITLVRTQGERKELTFTPQLSSQDYLTLALRTLPSDFLTDDLILTDFGTTSDDCSNLERIGVASFDWSVADKSVASQRRVIHIHVDSTRGQVTLWQEIVTGKYYPPSRKMSINPRIAEKVLRTAFDTFASTSEATTLLYDPNCYGVSFINYYQPSVWTVGFDSQILKRKIYYEVDLDRMQASLVSDRGSSDAILVFLSLGVLILLSSLYIRLELRRLARSKQS